MRSVGGEARNSLAVVESRVEDHQSVIYRNGAADFEMTVEDVEAVDYAPYTARPMHANAARPIAHNMLAGASAQRLPLSCAKNVKKGILMPE